MLNLFLTVVKNCLTEAASGRFSFGYLRLQTIMEEKA